jgi:ferredoxin
MSDEVNVSVDVDSCVASALCKRLAPTLFDLPEDSEAAVVLKSRVSEPGEVALAWEAKDGCPGMAIEVEEA